MFSPPVAQHSRKCLFETVRWCVVTGWRLRSCRTKRPDCEPFPSALRGLSPAPIHFTATAGCPRGPEPRTRRPARSWEVRRTPGPRVQLPPRSAVCPARPHGPHGASRAVRAGPVGPVVSVENPPLTPALTAGPSGGSCYDTRGASVPSAVTAVAVSRPHAGKGAGQNGRSPPCSSAGRGDLRGRSAQDVREASRCLGEEVGAPAWG